MKCNFVFFFQLSAIALMLCLACDTWAQEVPAKSVKPGWALQLGSGILYGGNLGILAENQVKLSSRFRISPFGSLGIADGGTAPNADKRQYWFGYAAGINLEYGKKHRIILGPHFMGNNYFGNATNVKKDYRGGFSTIVGYKGTADFGLIWMVYIGNVYAQNDEIFSDDKTYENQSHVGIGLGYKF